MEAYQNDTKWEELAKWSEEMGIQSWNKNVVCMSTIHPCLLMGSRLSVQKLIDGATLCDQYGQVYADSKRLHMLCVASSKTCQYCIASKRFNYFYVQDRDHNDDLFLDTVQKAARLLRKLLLMKRIVLVHCHSGRNRSALLILVYCAMYTDYTYAQALFKIRKYNSSRFRMQSTLSNSSFIASVRQKWDEMREE